jgi:predicted Zn-dependent protease
VCEKLGLQPAPLHTEVNDWFRCLDREAATELLAASLAQGNAEQAQDVFQTCFAAHGDQRIGLYVLLAACGVNVSAEPAFEYHLTGQTTPLARYLFLVTGEGDGWVQRQGPLNAGSSTTLPDGWLRSLLLSASGSLVRSDNPGARLAVKALEQSTPPGDFLHQLAQLRDLSRRWQEESNPLTPLYRGEDLRRSLAYVLAHRHTAAGRALLLTMQAHAQHQPARWRALADAWGLLGRDGDYPARYEQACCLLEAGDRAAARAHFLTLYEDTLAAGVLPPLDERCRRALEEEDADKDGWAPLLRDTAQRLVKAKNRPAVVLLALQVFRLNDRLLADNLVTLALSGDMEGKDKDEVALAAVDYLVQTEQPERGQALVEELLARHPKAPGLWRLAADLAERRSQRGRSITCLERALDLEYANLPEIIALDGWRRDYRKLLSYYHQQAQALHEVRTTPPADLALKVVRAVDRWRAHDPEPGDGSQTAAATLALLQQRELAWDYHTTPFAGNNGAERSLPGMAANLTREGDYDLAARAYAAACAAEPSDGQLTWERAQMLRQAGHPAEADRLLRGLVEDKEVSAPLRARVRWQLGERSKP